MRRLLANFFSLGTELTPFFAVDRDKKVTPPPRDELKRKKEVNTNVNGAIGVCAKVCEAVMQKPWSITNPEFKFLREFVHVVSSQPHLYPPLLPTNAPRLETCDAQSTLTKGVATSLYGRQTFLKKMAVVITMIDDSEVSVATTSSSKSKKSEKMKRITLQVADGDHNIVTVKLATQFNTSSSLLDTGCILEIISYTPIYYNFNDHEDDRVAILLLGFHVLGTTKLPKELHEIMHSKRPRLVVAVETKTEPVEQDTSNEAAKKEICTGQICSTPDVCLCLHW